MNHLVTTEILMSLIRTRVHIVQQLELGEMKMVRVIPFKAYRYNSQKIEDMTKVLAPPYDIIKGKKVDENDPAYTPDMPSSSLRPPHRRTC
mgnify:CR=1 FL=1